MIPIKDPAEAAAWSAAVRQRQGTVGLVPTMGALHAGHLALVHRAMEECTEVMCSIFVNPLQFNNLDDLRHYPRQVEKDIALLIEVGCHAVFLPDEKALFAAFKPRDHDLGRLTDHWEGPSRPGHFQGVVNVVERLFFYSRPDRAYFGEKDRQQLAIIQYVARNLGWPETIVPCPTLRDPDGLAMSSRNQRLSPEERPRAAILHLALQEAARLAYHRSPGAVRDAALVVLAREPDVRLDYFGIADAATLEPLYEWDDRADAVALIAAHVGPVRLIDNLTLPHPRVPFTAGP